MTFNHRRTLRAAAACLLGLLPLSLPASATETAWVFDGERALQVAVVRDDESRAKGLMHRIWLAPNSGMLFVFDPPAPVSFWMKNTLLPLDIRFYDRRGRLLAHYPHAMPCTRRPCELYPALGHAAYVLETPATFRAVPRVIPPLLRLLSN